MLKKEIAKIDFEKNTANQIKNKVRGLNPIMGAYAMYEEKKIKFWKVQALDDENAGEIMKKNGIEKTKPRTNNTFK